MALKIKKEILDKDPKAYVVLKIDSESKKITKGSIGSFVKVYLSTASQDVLKYLKSLKGIDYIIDEK